MTLQEYLRALSWDGVPTMDGCVSTVASGLRLPSAPDTCPVDLSGQPSTLYAAPGACFPSRSEPQRAAPINDGTFDLTS